MDEGYLAAPDGTGKGPQISKNIYYCPSGNPDQVVAMTSSAGSNAIPSSDLDGQGAVVNALAFSGDGALVAVASDGVRV